MERLRKKYYELYRKELFDSCLPFWLKNGADEKNGGLSNCLDREGNVFSSDKSVWMQGRAGWMFSRICNAFGNVPEYLAFAKSCIDFENAHCFDKDGRMFFAVTADGKPLRKRRYWFSEGFYVSACAEYYLATGDKAALENAKRVYDMIYGIFAGTVKDPFEIFPKTYPETRSSKDLASPMILLNVSGIMRRADKDRTAYYDGNAAHCIEEIKSHYFPEMSALLENVAADGGYIAGTSFGRQINPGHDMECAYFLAEEAEYRNDENLVALAEKIFNDAVRRGWDEKYGGFIYFTDAENKPVETCEHDMKLWWVHNEGINASLILYKLTGKKEYADWFEKITEYSFAHFSDKKYGEWYGYLRRDGKPTEPPCKGCTFKGPFHVLRMLVNVLQLLGEKENEL